MSVQFDSAVSALEEGARSRGADSTIEKRLSYVQSFLKCDLAAVEEALGQAIEVGTEPGRSAGRHLIERGGKRVRPMTLLLAAKCFGAAREERFFEMAAVVELAHSATLLHDDVVDEGMERRGAPTARRIFGNGVSVLAGDMLLIDALKRTERCAPALLSQFIETLSRLVNGEIVQLRGRTELDVSESTYERILLDKTASLFSFAASAGAQMAGASKAEQDKLGSFGESLGVAFQLVDDVIDYEGNQSGKTLLADLVEGKLTLPLVLAIEKDPSLSELVAKIHAGDASSVDEVSRRVLESGSCEEVRARALDYTEKAVEALALIEDSPAKALMAVVAREMTRRVA